MNPEEKLTNILKTETERLRSSYPLQNVLFAVVEIIRSVDFQHFMLSPENHPESKLLLERYQFGWSIAFAGFYKEFRLTDNVPLFRFDKFQREWTDSILQHAGKIGLTQQFLDFRKGDLVQLEEKENCFNFFSTGEAKGIEYYERLSLAYYHSLMSEILEAKSKPLMKELPKMRKKLENLVSVRPDKFIEYKATPEIDEFYSSFGYLYLMTSQLTDDFGEEDQFGGIKYKKYLDFAQDLLKGIIMHRDFCMAAAIKSSHKVYLKDVLTHAFQKETFLKEYSQYSEWNEEEVSQVLSCFTLNRENMDYHLSYPKASAPPYIMLRPDTIMRSAYGSMDRPVFFLNRELKRRFPRDYFNAVNKRENRFRNQLYSLFPEHKIQKIEENVNIRSHKLVTDIDAVLYDKERKILGLFQLKWQDTFSSSMRERFSRISNLIPKSVEWIDKVEDWLQNTDIPGIAKTLRLEGHMDHVDDIYLFVLSRNHVHFTGQKLDDRALWASWYQLIEASGKVKDPSNSNPIGELAAKLKLYSPEIRMQRDNIRMLEKMEFKLSKHKISFEHKRNL